MNFDLQEYLDGLSRAPLSRFADWPNRELPDVCAGVYTIYHRHELSMQEWRELALRPKGLK